MRRINIDLSLFTDPRFDKLSRKFDQRATAIGVLVEAWILAQKWYLTEEQTTPVDEWEKHGISNEIIDAGLATIEGDRIRVKGADEYFGWLKVRGDAAKKGGLASAQKRSSNQTEAKATKSNQKQPSYSSSSSSSKKKNNNTSSGDDPHPLFKIWNENRHQLPQAQLMNKKRQTACERLWRRNSDPEHWAGIVQRLAQSSFCRGEVKDWKATFDFFLQDATEAKVIEGQFDNRSTGVKFEKEKF